MRRFEFKDAKSNKFWEVEVKGKNLQVTFGKIGTEGQSKPKAFATPEKAIAEMEKLISEKTGKGYVEVGGKGVKAAKSLYPEIKRLKDAGATLIRTVFEGVGDDGCFFSTVYKNNEILAISNQLDCYNGDIGRIYVNNNMELPTGEAWGCTSILIIELANGKCSIGGGFLDRQNELFENLVWEGVEEIKATILITKEEDEEDDDYSISTLALEKKIEIKPCSNLPKGKKLLKDKAENALQWWVNCEGQTSIDGETPFFEGLASDYKVNSFDLTINTEKKLMEIKAGKKKINIKLSGIKTKKFTIKI